MAKYSDKFKASAVITLQASGYPDNPYKLKDIAKSIRVPHRTLRRWYNNEVGAPSDKVVTQEKRDMTNELKALVWKLITHAGNEDTVSEMSGQQTITSIGILIDKIRLLTGLPTQIVQIMPSLMTSFENAGIDATDFFQKAKARADAIAKERD